MRRTKAFIVQRSRGDDIKIDEEELDKVVEGMSKGAVVVCKHGIINPSYVTGVIPDTDRIAKWRHEVKHYHDEEAEQRGIEPLSNQFSGTKIGGLIDERVKQFTKLSAPKYE